MLSGKTKIFIVEDETIIVEDLKERLTEAGFDVIGTAISGNQAIDEIKRLKPDLVIMDVRIAGELNGIEVAIIIQSYFDGRMPVVFLTGFSSSAFNYLKVLPDYIYLNKPFNASTLLKAVQRALQQQESQ